MKNVISKERIANFVRALKLNGFTDKEVVEISTLIFFQNHEEQVSEGEICNICFHSEGHEDIVLMIGYESAFKEVGKDVH